MWHYFEDPQVASRPIKITTSLRGRSVTLDTDRGVFSRGDLDPGTRVLLSAVPPPPSTGDLLDLGCGYGPIAASLAFEAPAARVWAVDVNSRARALCQRNCANLGLTNVFVHPPDEVPESVRFAVIWSNPPIRVGKAALHEILDHWLSRLTADGRAFLVVQKNLGSDSLHSWLSEAGWSARRLVSRQSFRVLDVRGRPAVDDAGAAGPDIDRRSK
jgi:16S rRNA (guanine1207-N2)-methyltransferase